MLFNTPEFGVFFIVVLALYFCLGRRAQNLMLLAASLFFYGWWNVKLLWIMFLSTVIEFVCARAIDGSASPRKRKLFLATAIVADLTILGFYKYFDFFVESFRAMLLQAGVETDMRTLGLILPVGISFYTFQAMSYTIDVYRRELPASRNFLEFMLFVSYFPQLVAGPIERAKHLLPQFRTNRIVDWNRFVSGLFILLFGLFKKSVLADNLAPFVDRTFADPASQSFGALLGGMYAYALQIYLDFSGYSDIARGTSRMLGIDLMLNFRTPYLSPNITIFWRRWHVSLSQWFLSYLYIPLGGSRGGIVRTGANLLFTMLVCGLWHGANWTFVVWGGLHGVALIAHRIFLRGRKPEDADLHSVGGIVRSLPGILVTFHLAAALFVIFRCPSLEVAVEYFVALLRFEGSWQVPWGIPLVMAIALGMDAIQARTGQPEDLLDARRRWVPWAVSIAMFIALIFAGRFGHVAFIYFQF